MAEEDILLFNYYSKAAPFEAKSESASGHYYISYHRNRSIITTVGFVLIMSQIYEVIQMSD